MPGATRAGRAERKAIRGGPRSGRGAIGRVCDARGFSDGRRQQRHEKAIAIASRMGFCTGQS